MPFQPGQSGNPKGRAPNKPTFKPALLIALKRTAGEAIAFASDKIEPTDARIALQAVADRMVADALMGDKTAMQQIADRLDGKPAQAVNVAGADGGPFKVQISKVEDGL